MSSPHFVRETFRSFYLVSLTLLLLNSTKKNYYLHNSFLKAKKFAAILGLKTGGNWLAVITIEP